MCKKKKKEKSKSVVSVKEDAQKAAPPSDEQDEDESDDDELIDMSKLRWVRGANRIQSQVSFFYQTLIEFVHLPPRWLFYLSSLFKLQVVEAFRYKLNDAKQAGLYGSLSSLRSSANDLKTLAKKS